MPGKEEPRYYSLIEPLRESSSSCGYCHSKSDSSHTYGVWAHDLSPQVYQMMMDRGWRRSGSYLYLPDRRTTCCPPYTIRCSASGFQASRGQRQAAYRWRKFIQGATENSGVSKQQKTQSTFDLCQVFDFDDAQGTPPTIKEHEFQIRIEPAAFTEEKFKLYKKYQIEVHNDQAEKVTKKSFESFLCTNPFRSDRSVAKHACWLVDDQLIAFSVIDILPLGISSVYLVWDTDYAKYGLGRLASLREIAWIQEWRASKFGEEFDWYYLGFYIHSCPKMTYKAEYSPSFLLDPSALDWWPLEDCIPILDASESNVTSFASSDVNQEDKKTDRADFPVKILTQTGAIETVKSSDPRVKEVVEKLGAEIVRLSLICI